jgi:hypothetical protein
LTTTVLTSVTRFGFTFMRVLPSHIVGTISLVVLLFAILARYTFHLASAWRWIYVISAAMALYFNIVVGVIQAFLKIPLLKAAAPTQSEPPFVAAQLVVLALFVVLTVVAVRKLRNEPVSKAASRSSFLFPRSHQQRKYNER